MFPNNLIVFKILYMNSATPVTYWVVARGTKQGNFSIFEKQNTKYFFNLKKKSNFRQNGCKI